MGDELHMRSQATGNLLIRELAPAFAAVGGEASARFIAGNHHFFLNLDDGGGQVRVARRDGRRRARASSR